MSKKKKSPVKTTQAIIRFWSISLIVFLSGVLGFIALRLFGW